MARVFDVPEATRASTILREWKKSPVADPSRWPESRRVRISLCGFGTLSYLVPPVESAALADGFVPEVTVGGYNQLVQDLMGSGSGAVGSEAEIVWIWSGLEDLLPSGFANDRGSLASEPGRAAALAAVDSLVAQIRNARGRTRALVLVTDFVPARRSPLGIADGSREQAYEDVFRSANARLLAGLRTIDGASVFPLDSVVRRLGLDRATDPRLLLAADCRFTPELFARAATALRPYVRALKGAARKVLVLDLDNTLWGGIVGEDGWEGVRVGDDPVGRAYARFQSAVLELQRRGVVLAINSKNNVADVEELFANRKDMPLGLDHFAAVLANWNDKAANCRAIAEELNLGLDSLVFWDDNPAERALVRESLDDVVVVEVPKDPSSWADLVTDLTWFDTLHLTAEDLQRSAMYAEDRRRREAAEVATDLGAFLASLELRVSVSPASDANIPRIVSLLGRTNQFNLTTQRHTETRIREMAADDSWSVLSYAAEDRFGQYGIVGVTIARRQPDAVEIDSLLLSCRALGKGIEDTMLAQIARLARQWEVPAIRATYIPTRKNVLIRDFLPSNRFQAIHEREGTVDYERQANGLPVPEHVVVDVEGLRRGVPAR
jgi:FkbH-like protein